MFSTAPEIEIHCPEIPFQQRQVFHAYGLSRRSKSGDQNVECGSFPSIIMPSHQRLVQLQNHLSSPPSEDLVLTKHSPNRRIVTIAINNARHANCLSVAVLTALLSALQSINPQIKLEESIDSEDPISFAERVSQSHILGQIPKVVIIKSEGKVFCSGHDLKELRSGEFHTIHEIFKLCNTLMLTIRRLPQIVISQVQGIATAAGCQLAAQADLCVASPEATFSTPGVKIGGFCTTPSVSISRSIHTPKQALRMLLTGEHFSSQKAYECGLVSHIAEGDLNEFAMKLAEDIGKAASTTLFLGKRGYYRQRDMELAEAYEFAGRVMAGNFTMRDSKEGISAFFEKRAPEWD